MPLIIRFPGQRKGDTVRENVELLDVAPTIVDVLGLPIPKWMVGISLLRGDLRGTRPIFSVITSRGRGKVRVPGSLSTLQSYFVTDCNHQYQLSLFSGASELREVPGHTTPCPDPTPGERALMRSVLLESLKEKRVRFRAN